jgi:hypothetical protein
MFVLAQTDLFSEPTQLPAHARAGPAGALVAWPEFDEGLDDHVSGALRSYCDRRISYNQRERRAVRLGGLSALWIGVPIVVLGYLLVIFAGRLVGPAGNFNLVFDITGWGACVGGNLVPARRVIFGPLVYGRENRALQHQRTAEISVVPPGRRPGHPLRPDPRHPTDDGPPPAIIPCIAQLADGIAPVGTNDRHRNSYRSAPRSHDDRHSRQRTHPQRAVAG